MDLKEQQEFTSLKQKVDDDSERLDKHIAETMAQFEEGARVHEQLINSVDENTQAVIALAENSSGVIALHEQLKTAVRIGLNVQKFGLWVITWPLVGIGLLAIWKWLTSNFGSAP